MDNPKYKELKGKVVGITGGGGILCSTLAHAFANQGAKVCVMDLNREAAQTVSEKINNAGGSAMCIKVDVLDRESLEEAKKAIAERFGPCDILINGAGGEPSIGNDQ
ncbi:SDR family NAD(P)-dependent oxidoreductase [Flagellimonas chongwuensis]|uniref:SDR family NAD(P)-dependent oxidoreductase n=1 Tax=Flagellimonas chongwuensis TaxID=2697365 RepID=UPI0021CF7654|nr:SDR family NAD(P)-dependent oxidoreductase [Allomuricauda chongwuensis]